MTEPFGYAIVTRMGIGVRRPDFYEYRIAVMRLTLAKSWAAQIDQGFRWITAIDVEAPDWVESRLTDGIANPPEVIRRDPRQTGLSAIDHGTILQLGGSKRCVIVRIDDDDLMHREALARIRQHAEGSQGLTAGCFSRGFDLRRKSAVEIDYPWFSALTWTVSGPGKMLTPYAVNHKKLGRFIGRNGGNILIDSDAPMWGRLRHEASDSVDARVRATGSETGSKAEFRPADYGLDDRSYRELQRFVADNGPRRATPDAGQRKHSRLEVKNSLIRHIRRIATTLEQTPQSQRWRLERDIDRMMQAFYDV